jgi:integrase/recombinase XerD
LPTFGPDAVAALLKWKPKETGQHRLSALICFLLDSGARIDEALSITWKDLNLNDCLVTLWGKGRKQRTVPFSNELRRRLYLWSRKSTFTQATDFVFCTRQGLKQGRRNVLRDVKILCRELGFEPPARTLHACRHSFATFFIRSGGNPLTLQRLLGHTSLEMTRRYVSLNVEDLRREHRSLLGLGTPSSSRALAQGTKDSGLVPWATKFDAGIPVAHLQRRVNWR